MATAESSSSLLDVVSSLSQDDIPFKLRCAICNRLALNGFRLPCCDQAICETCQASLPESCPVCAHSPLDGTLCKPNKALRTTLKAFLRTEEKKRERDRPQPTPTPLEGSTVHKGDASTTQITDASGTPRQAGPEDANHARRESVEAAPPTPCDVDGVVPDASRARDDEYQSTQATADGGPSSELPTVSSEQMSNAHVAPNNPTSGVVPDGQSFPAVQQPYANDMNFTMNSGSALSNMDWQGPTGYGQMMAFMGSDMQHGGMMPFQNQMGPTGMSPIGMDPMASQGMFSGYGMDMSGMSQGMNMGMGFGGGQGMYGSWDGQNNMWIGGPDKFNANALANRMGAGFGPDPGYRGYNMSHPSASYPHMQQHQQQPRPNFQFPGPSYGPHGHGYSRGRGYPPGGRGRGGYPPRMQGNNFPPTQPGPGQQQYPQQQQQQQASGASASGANPGMSMAVPLNSEADINRFKDELNPGGADDIKELQLQETETPDAAARATVEAGDSQTLSAIPTIGSEQEPSHGRVAAGNRPSGLGTTDPSYPHGGSPEANGFEVGANGTNTNVPQPALPPGHAAAFDNSGEKAVIDAPVAPRAMREGLPNTRFRHNRAYPSLNSNSNSTAVAASPQSKEINGSSGKDDRDESKPNADEAARSTSRSRPRSSHRRHRSPSRSAGSSEDVESRERHSPRRSHRDGEDEDLSRRATRHRSLSPSGARAGPLSHRGKRDRGKEHHRDRERDRSTKRSDEKASSHRSHRRRGSPSRHRDESSSRGGAAPAEQTRAESTRESKAGHNGRSREKHEAEQRRDRRRERDRDRGGEREKERGRGRKRSRRDRSGSREPSTEQPRHRSRRLKRDDERGSLTEARTEGGDRGSRRSQTNGSVTKSAPTPRDGEETTAEAGKDPHTLEREARNRERMLKEQQRREAVQADHGGRRRDSKTERRGLGGGRRVSYKYEDEISDQMCTEQEREASRWA